MICSQTTQIECCNKLTACACMCLQGDWCEIWVQLSTPTGQAIDPSPHTPSLRTCFDNRLINTSLLMVKPTSLCEGTNLASQLALYSHVSCIVVKWQALQNSNIYTWENPNPSRAVRLMINAHLSVLCWITYKREWAGAHLSLSHGLLNKTQLRNVLGIGLCSLFALCELETINIIKLNSAQS